MPGTNPLPRSDVFVIGGGIIGASIAWQLSILRYHITLIEASTLGAEASWAGAGMLVPGSEYDDDSPALRFALDSLQRYPDFVATLQDASGAHIDFSLCGSLELASSAEQLERARRKAATQQKWGILTRHVASDELRSLLPNLRTGIAGATFYPGEGQVDPRKIMHALRIALQKSGAHVREHCAVTAIHLREHGVALTLQTGEHVEAPHAVLAAGAWSTTFTEAPTFTEAFPVKGHLLGYTRSPGSLPHVVRCGHTYVVQRETGYTIAGTSEERADFNRSVDPATVDAIHQRARDLLPAFLDAPPSEAWIGFRPATADGHPVIERYQNSGLYLAYGHYRNGILLAPATAHRISELITHNT